MSRFEVSELPLAGLCRITRKSLGDARGAFARLFCSDELSVAGWPGPIAQINHSRTSGRGAVRGMHFQHPPHGEAKLVMCLKGEIFDVAVDLRAGSPTFGQWHGEVLSRDNGHALLIPIGFAHGFQALTEEVEMIYCHSSPYQPAAEGGVHPHDPRLAIDWPFPITQMSDKDASRPCLGSDYAGLVL